MSLEAWGDENPADADYDSWADRAMDAGWFDPADYSPGAMAILQERERQETGEGWTPEHDDAHVNGEIAGAAACYVLYGLASLIPGQLGDRVRLLARDLWPWAADWWKPATYRRMLVKAGALIAAEIDRLDRLEARAGGKGSA